MFIPAKLKSLSTGAEDGRTAHALQSFFTTGHLFNVSKSFLVETAALPSSRSHLFVVSDAACCYASVSAESENTK